MLVGDAECVDWGDADVDGFAIVVEFFADAFGEKLAVPVGQADEFLGIRH